MSTGALKEELPAGRSDTTLEPAPEKSEFQRLSATVAAGWLATNLGLQIGTFALKFVLSEQVKLDATAISSFFFFGNLSNYIKPLAGVLTDSVPLCGTRRRHYLLFSLLATGVFWILLSLVPRQYAWMLPVYTLMYFGVMFTSTTLGGVMVEIGQRFRAAGRLTSQRIGMFKLADLTGVKVASVLAYFPFQVPACICAAFHLALIPFLMRFLPRERPAELDREALAEVARQGRVLVQSRTLLAAAGMIFLLAAAPGVGTPLFIYQTKILGFSKGDLGTLGFISAVAGMAAATLYFAACRRFNLRNLVAVSIVIHTLGVLCYLFYHSWEAALVISAITGITGTLAMLPVYDIAARATPKGSEAIGYALMMSVWNLTNAWADWIGSYLFDHRLGKQLTPLIWIDAVSTLVVIAAVPFLPRALSQREDSAAK